MALSMASPESSFDEYRMMLDTIEELFPGKTSMSVAGVKWLTCIPVFNDQASREDISLVIKHYAEKE